VITTGNCGELENKEKRDELLWDSIIYRDYRGSKAKKEVR
jgi:hypothetical protein